MLTRFDDYPIHQVPLPLAQAGSGHPDFYDRFWFNGYTEDFYFAIAFGIYPNRGVVDAAFAVVHNDIQRSVFVSGRAPFDRSRTEVGPIRIEIVEPMRVCRVVVDAPEQNLQAELVFEARTAAFEEPRQTRFTENRLAMDLSRATQFGSWRGRFTSGEHTIDLGEHSSVYGTKDRSWGVRPVGDPAPMAPIESAAQWFFLWAPLHFDDSCVHYMVFEHADGQKWSEVGAMLPVLGDGDDVVGPAVRSSKLTDVDHQISWAKGLRRANSAALVFRQNGEQTAERIDLDPVLTFRMAGAGYQHPEFVHGRWRGELVVSGEESPTSLLDDVQPRNLHVQQVVRAHWGDRTGLGILEQIAVGPHAPSGFTGLNDGWQG